MLYPTQKKEKMHVNCIFFHFKLLSKKAAAFSATQPGIALL